jgi:hypothetical protein
MAARSGSPLAYPPVPTTTSGSNLFISFLERMKDDKNRKGTGCFCRLPEVMYRAEIRECLGECGLLPAFQNAEVLHRILSLQNECQLLLLVFSSISNGESREEMTSRSSSCDDHF